MNTFFNKGIDICCIKRIICFALPIAFWLSQSKPAAAHADHYTIRKIQITGNHKTKDITIINELSFRSGNRYNKVQLQKEIKRSEDNLRRTPLFHSVNIVAGYDSSCVDITIDVIERWYLWPEIYISHADQNFSNWLKNKVYLRSNFGLGLMKYNFRGRNEKISFFAMAGYDQLFMTEYTGIKLRPDGNHILNIYLKTGRRKETSARIINDTIQYIESRQEFILHDFSSFVSYIYRPQISFNHELRAGIRNRRINDSLQQFNPDYLRSGSAESRYLYLRYQFNIDTRNTRLFPHSGNALSMRFEKTGLGIFGKHNSVYTSINYTHYQSVSSRISWQNHLAFKSSLGSRQPFYLNNALGSNNHLSGYEYYTIHGSDYLFLQSRLTAEILKQEIYLKFIPWEQFNRIPLKIYLQIYTGFGHVNNTNFEYLRNNRLANKNLYSVGLGLNFLTYYDKLFRMEYSINHMQEHGLFLYFHSAF